MRNLFLPFFLVATALLAAQTDDMPGMDRSNRNTTDSGMERPDMSEMNSDSSSSAMEAMQSHRLDMGPHMKMTTLRPLQPGDQQRADAIVQAARAAAEKYQDYKTALADGYKIFLPNVPQKQYHFTNYRYAFRSRRYFDPSRPTSLLYEKHGDVYKLIGVMYTAKKNASKDELNSRIPLSIAQWHAHVNLCMPPKGRRQEVIAPHAKFGLAGSISTREECDAAGGKFYPQVFGWMVHVYPFEQKPESIWSVERQHNHTE